MNRTPPWDFLVTTSDPNLINLAVSIGNLAGNEGYNDSETVNLVLAFVQSLPYTVDNVTT